MTGELVSIIIPMYSVEAYLPQCLDSVCGQTWQNLEILLIDDESPDRSGEIADEYASRDPRIKVMHIQNRGAAGARNVGLDIASGEYIMFVDSDDWLELTAVEKLLSIIREKDCDIAQCQYADEYTTGSVPHLCDEDTVVVSKEEFLRRMLRKWEDILIWNKLFSKKVLNEVRFEEGHCIDDEFFTYRTILKAKAIVVTGEILYHYRHRLSGAMRNPEKERQRFHDQIDFVTERFKPIVRACPGIREELSVHLIEVLFHVIRNGAEHKEVFQRARKILRKYGNPMLFEAYEWPVKKSIIAYLIHPREWFLKRISPTGTNQEGCFT